jgi:hypothetical protein
MTHAIVVGRASFRVAQQLREVRDSRASSVHRAQLRRRGSGALECDGTVFDVEPGDFVFLPVGSAHTFPGAPQEPLHTVQITVPAGFEVFTAEAGGPGRPGRGRRPPPHRDPRPATGLAVAGRTCLGWRRAHRVAGMRVAGMGVSAPCPLLDRITTLSGTSVARLCSATGGRIIAALPHPLEGTRRAPAAAVGPVLGLPGPGACAPAGFRTEGHTRTAPFQWPDQRGVAPPPPGRAMRAERLRKRKC